MPTYRLKCDKCNRETTVSCAIEERNSQVCGVDGCGKSALKTVPSTGGFKLKGGGWYRDGYTK